MKKLLSLTIAASLLGTAVSETRAQSAQFIFTPVALHPVPGGAITFRIDLMFTAGGNMPDLAGLTFFLQQIDPASPFPLSIITMDRVGSPFIPPGPPGEGGGSLFAAPIPPIFPDRLNSTTTPVGSNARDLGALVDPNISSLGSGTYFVGTLTLEIALNAPLTNYSVQSTITGGKRSIINDSTGFITLPIAPASISFAVVPEPGVDALLIVGGLIVVALGLRRHLRHS